MNNNAAHIIDYVHMDLSRLQRSMLAQLRCGILPLRIETGRYERKAEAGRLRKFCDDNSIESEALFLFQWPQYLPYRDRLTE